jgi:CYTH domain-containing protein
MTEEIEGKYLLFERGDDFTTQQFRKAFAAFYGIWDVRSVIIRDMALRNGLQISQGYLEEEAGRGLAYHLRLNLDFEPAEYRIRQEGRRHFFTCKDAGGLVRRALADISIDEALFNTWWKHTEGYRLYKKRIVMPYVGGKLEIDVIDGRDLVLCEAERSSLEEVLEVPAPGMDVSEDSRYKSRNLAK